MLLSTYLQESYRKFNLPNQQEYQELHKMMENVDCVLLDMDGVALDFFAIYPAYSAADQMKTFLYKEGVLFANDRLPMNPESVRMQYEDDPLAILRFYGSLCKSKNSELRAIAYKLESILCEWECRAAGQTIATDLFDQFVECLVSRNKKIAVTTNNSPKAVKIFLKKSKVIRFFEDNVFGRTSPDPEALKPNKDMLCEAMEALKADPSRTLMIGDSVSDKEAADKAGVRYFLGMAYTDAKQFALLEAGVEIVIKSFIDFLGAMEYEIEYFISDPGKVGAVFR
ncbi:HAD family hydrolase [Shimazuella alba]|uniref:HAD-IA family hydrolase n=1 Tax=Shimazuella alba TaxID=2690964 RepID=A0A6I4VSV6_9BACL|nr:HAD-IA family hydrolase [Shimazuella alba]MXQ54819.1 HAD-IA family hydrolase [Shimazuella alba]